jgi:hypothetical protein
MGDSRIGRVVRLPRPSMDVCDGRPADVHDDLGTLRVALFIIRPMNPSRNLQVWADSWVRDANRIMCEPVEWPSGTIRHGSSLRARRSTVGSMGSA